MKIKKNLSFYTGLIFLLFTVIQILFYFIKPSDILLKLNFSFITPDKVNNLIAKQIFFLLIIFFITTAILWLYKSRFYPLILSKFISLLNKITLIINYKLLSVILISYLAVLFLLSIINFDLGFDEAWYLHWAKNFSATGIALYSTNGQISLIDTITMLPYYLVSTVVFWSGGSEVWHFKLLSTLFSIVALLYFFYFIKTISNKIAALLSVLFLIIQPGFAFISTSFFGELFQIFFVLIGLKFWLYDNYKNDSKNIILPSLFFSIAIHTKFQLLIVLFLTIFIFSFIVKKQNTSKILLYTLLFTVFIIFIRTLPVVFTDIKNLRYLLIMDWVSGNSISQSLSLTAFDKIQLFNRFFSVPLFLVVIFASFLYFKKPIVIFLTVFSAVTSVWWILLFPYSTYRHPFIAIISICILSGLLIYNWYNITDLKIKNSLRFKFIVISTFSFLMLYGFSANIFYSYIGYNDGVQFDLDGFNSRLFEPVKHDNSQKDFHAELKKIVSPLDTLYNGSFVTRFYLPNTIFTKEKISESLKNSPDGDTKYFLVTRDVYPLGFTKIYAELDSLAAVDTLQVQLLLKKGEHELYGIAKTQR